MKIRLAVTSLALGLMSFAQLAPQNPGPSPPVSQRKSRPQPVKLSLDELKQHLTKERKGIYPKGDALFTINKQGGVAFVCTAEVRDDLRRLEASDAVLRASECPYPELTPQTQLSTGQKAQPPQARAGPVTITCTPEDCEVAVLRRELKTAEKGVAIIPDLPPGETIFEIRRMGFQSAQKVATLKEGEPTPVSATLPPLESSQRQWATAALIKAIGSTGGFMESAGLLPLAAHGSVSLSDDKGNSKKFTVTARIWSSQSEWALFSEVGATTGKRKQGCIVGTPPANEKKTQPCSVDLREALKMWVDYQFPFVVERALSNSGGLRAETDKPDSSGYVATVETTSETTKIHLSETYEPVSVSVRGSAEGDIPLEVEYSDFANVRTAKCPRKVSITKGAKKTQFEFTELSSVAPDAPLK